MNNKIIFILIFSLHILVLFRQTKPEEYTYPPSWSSMELKGKVKSIQETVEYRNLKLVNSDSLVDNLLNEKNTYLFDEEGFVYSYTRNYIGVNNYKNFSYIKSYDSVNKEIKIDEFLEEYFESLKNEIQPKTEIIRTYTLDSNKKLILWRNYPKSGFWPITFYTYDDHGNLTCEKTFNQNDSLESLNEWFYMYDKSDNIIRKIYHYYSERWNTSRIEFLYYDYDSLNNLIKEIYESSDYGESYTFRIFPDTSGENKFYRTEYKNASFEGVKYYVSEYNTHKLLLSKKFFTSTNKLLYEYIYQYDSLNRVIAEYNMNFQKNESNSIKFYEYDTFGNIKTFKEYFGEKLIKNDRYEFDNYGNWIQKIQIPITYGYNPDKEVVIKRKIEYY